MTRYIAIKRAGLMLLGVLVALVGLELVARLSSLDERLMASAVVFQAADRSAHRISDDPFLHYELKPSASFEGQHPFNGWAYSVHIDANGARMPEHSAQKPSDTIRILAFGGSTLYGGGVNDSETLPAAMERRWATERHSGRLEVWNFGTSAYNLAQASHLARAKLRELNPDLVLVQVHNQFPRPFFAPEDGSPWETVHRFRETDPWLMAEQFRRPEAVPQSFHDSASKHSALYRGLLAAHERYYGVPPGVSLELSQSEARLLSEEGSSRHVPVVFVQIPADRGQLDRNACVFPGVAPSDVIDLFQPGRAPEFYEVHPPPAILEAYAELLLQELVSRKFLPVAAPSPP